MSSEKQITANRANAQHSTGPTSPEGKVRIAHNAVKTGLTGRTILLPTDDVPAYEAHVARVFRQFAPKSAAGKEDRKDDPTETLSEIHRLTQSLADTLWRLDRIPSREAGVYAIGRRQLAGAFADEPDEAVRNAMIEAQVLLTYRRDLTNLSIQAMRLRRQYEQDEKEVKRLLAEREAAAQAREEAETERWENAVEHYECAKKHRLAFNPAEIGFEFSKEDLERYMNTDTIRSTVADGTYYEFKKRGWLQPAAA